MSNPFTMPTAIIRKFRISKLSSVSLILCIKWGFHYSIILGTDVFYRSTGPVFFTLVLGTMHDS